MKESCFFEFFFSNIEGEKGRTVPTNVSGIVGGSLVVK